MREVLRLLGGLLAAALVAYPFTLVDAELRVTLVAVLAGGAAVNALVLWSDGAVTLAAAAMAGLYLLALYTGSVGLDPLAPVVGGLLLAFVEVCDLALGVPPFRPVDRSLLWRALATVAWAMLAGLLAGGLVLMSSTLPALPRAVAMLGAALAVGVPVLLRDT